MIFRKMLAITLILIIAVSVIPQTAFAGTEGIPDGWTRIPISRSESSDHIAFQLEEGVLTFHDFGDPSRSDYGRMPDYTNTGEPEANYSITPWYQQRDRVHTVVFDETISYIGAYTLTNMNGITGIRFQNPNATLKTNLCLFSTTNRAEPLRIYAASTVKTVDQWIRGNSMRKLSETVSDATLYYTDLSHLADELKELEAELSAGGAVDTATLCRALALVEGIPIHAYSLSDYRCAVEGTGDILSTLWQLSSGSCGEQVTYALEAAEQEGSLNLIISGTGSMAQYRDISETPWKDMASCITDVTIGEQITALPDHGLPEDAAYHVRLNSEAYTIVKNRGYDIQLDTLRVLCIGNSHTADYSEFLSNILLDLKNTGFDTEVVIHRAGIGSIGLFSGRNSNANATHRSHLEAIRAETGAYTYLKKNRYDLIIVQDYMESVVDEPAIFKEGLATFIQEVKTIAGENGHGEPQVAWFADWVDIRTTGGDSALYDGNGNKMALEKLTRQQVYEKSMASVEAVETAIAQGKPYMPDFVIHGSTIKQNAMSSYLGSTRLWDKSSYCLLERDTTHLTYELGRYLLGAGVLSEVVNHYGDVLTLGRTGTDVGAALTLQNGPDASGDGSQYEGALNEELLAIVREAISSPNEFVESTYVTDPVLGFAEQVSGIRWDLEGIQDPEAILSAMKEQISAAIGEAVDAFAVEMQEFPSAERFTVLVRLRHGYSVREVELTVYGCQAGIVGHRYEDGFCGVCGWEIFQYTKDELVQALGGVDSTNGAVNTEITNNWYSDIPIPEGAEQVRYPAFKTAFDYGTVFLNGTTYLSGNCEKTLTPQWVTVDIPEDATVFRYCYVYDSIAEAYGIPKFEYLEFMGADLEGCDHSYESVVTAPTCTTGGYTTYTCVRCADRYIDNETAAGHTYADGICAVCGEKCFDTRPANGRHVFSVEVNIAPALHNGQDYVAGTDYGYIQFPTSYTGTGEATPLIIICHGAGANLHSYQSPEWVSNHYTIWTELGYAVMDMYACPSQLSGSTTELHYGNPSVVGCYKAGYDYVMERFNLKQDGVFVIGSSMGGLSSFQLVQSGLFPVIAQVGYCPVIDLYKQAYCNPWSSAVSQRSDIAKYFDFEGTAPQFTGSKYPSPAERDYFEANHDKIKAFSPILANVIAGDPTVIYDVAPSDPLALDVPEEAAVYARLTASHPCPLMIFHNLDDRTVSYRYSKYFKEMVERSGQEVILYTFESGGHNAWNNGPTTQVQGLNGTIRLTTSQYEAYLFFQKFQSHEKHSAWIDPAIAAGCTETGLTQGSHCNICGEVLTPQQEVPASGHTPKAPVKENETKTGYDAVVYCAVCGAELSREYVKTYLPGDINGDGKVNNKDATRLFQHLSGWSVEVMEPALDVNGDGKVNNKDATRLFQYLSGWEVKIH